MVSICSTLTNLRTFDNDFSSSSPRIDISLFILAAFVLQARACVCVLFCLVVRRHIFVQCSVYRKRSKYTRKLCAEIMLRHIHFIFYGLWYYNFVIFAMVHRIIRAHTFLYPTHQTPMVSCEWMVLLCESVCMYVISSMRHWRDCSVLEAISHSLDTLLAILTALHPTNVSISIKRSFTSISCTYFVHRSTWSVNLWTPNEWTRCTNAQQCTLCWTTEIGNALTKSVRHDITHTHTHPVSQPGII